MYPEKVENVEISQQNQMPFYVQTENIYKYVFACITEKKKYLCPEWDIKYLSLQRQNVGWKKGAG